MGFIDVNNINNYGEPVVGSFDWWKLSGLLGVCIGFGFTYLYNWNEERKLRNETGEAFENQLKSFKDPITRQAQDLLNYKDKITYNEYGVISIFLKHKFDLIKTLNWQILIKYFKKKNHKSPIELISSIYNSIDILNFQTGEILMTYSNFHKDILVLMKEYKTNLDSIRHEVAFYADALDAEELAADELLKIYNELDQEFIFSKNLDLKYMISLKDTYHLRILNDIPLIKNHKLLIPIQESNFKSRDIIHFLNQKIDEHKYLIESIIESHKENFKILYGEDLILNDIKRDTGLE